VPSSGCGRQAQSAIADQRVDVAAGGQGRYYLLTAPSAGASKALPLVINFHGLLEGAQIHSQMSAMGPVAQHDGFVVAFPNGSGNPIHWNVEQNAEGAADIAYVKAMVAQIGATRCIDTSRTYAMGLSDGSIFISHLACELPGTFAAYAMVSGLQVEKGCQPPSPQRILAFHGTADPILLFNGGVGSSLNSMLGGPSTGSTTTTTSPPANLTGPGYPANVAKWAGLDGCDSKFTDTKVSAHVIHRVYTCPAPAAVEFFIIEGGGHAWPGSKFSAAISKIVGPTTFEINADAEAWKFFQRFQLTKAAPAS
jgi:polyhydroxybutyrate depolymerase